MNDYSQSRLTLPARGERRSCQGGCLHAAKRITLAFVSAGHAAKGIAPVFASVGHAAVLPVRFFLPLFNFASLRYDAAASRFLWGGAFACGVDEVFRYNGPHD